MVAEHRHHRDLEVAHGVAQDRGLPALRGEVAGEQDQVDAPRERGERLTRLLAVALAAEMDVAGGGDPDPAPSGPPAGRWLVFIVIPRGGYPPRDAPQTSSRSRRSSTLLKRAAAALREADVPFLLGGSLASWARGGPETRHDLDLMIKPDDVERSLEALTEAGMRPSGRPRTGWSRRGTATRWSTSSIVPRDCRWTTT